MPDVTATIRWRLADDAPPTLFPDESAADRHLGTGAYAGMEFIHVDARRIINTVPTNDRLPFRHTINAYRGCSHACTYCFARPTHRYLGLGIGDDFDRKIIVKVNAVERLRAELRQPSWDASAIAMGTNTDPYQKAEGRYHLTRRLVEVLGEARNPFSILTKSTLLLRDLDVLTAAAERTDVHLAFSIGTLDRDVWRATEPGTPPPDKRIEAVAKLNEAGLRCDVLLAPVLPGLSDGDEQVRAVARAAQDAGARSITPLPLHLRGELREHYLGWLRTIRPDLVPLYERRFQRRGYQSSDEAERLRRLVAAATGASRRERPPAAALRRPSTSPRECQQPSPCVADQLALPVE